MPSTSKCREQAEREASPTACIIDSQSVKMRKKGVCIDPHGFDAGKLIKGKKRHVLVDTVGLLLHALVTSADVQDRDGGLLVLSTLFARFPFLKRLFADAAYAGPVFQDGLALAMPGLLTEIVRRCDQAKGFVVLPCWIVERTIAWPQLPSPTCQGLGKSQLHRARLPPPRLQPPHAQKTL